MADIVIKQYPEEEKAKLHTLVEAKETKEAFKALDDLDHSMATTASPTTDALKEWARRAIGYGNYLRKKLSRLEAAKKNTESNRCLEIKIGCDANKKTYSDSAAKTEASAYIAPLRTVTNVFESYVISADNIISVCRLSLYEKIKEEGHELEV